MALNYDLTADVARALDARADEIVETLRESGARADEIKNLIGLLDADAESFDALKSRPWFRKAWSLVSGERGALRDQSIENLGKAQLVVLRVITDIIQDSSELHETLIRVHRRLHRVEKAPVELKKIILRFNDRYRDEFRRIHGHVADLRKLMISGTTLVTIGMGIAAVLSFNGNLGALDGHAVQFLLGAGTVTLSLLTFAGFRSAKRHSDLIPLKAMRRQLGHGATLPRETCHLLGLDGSQQSDERKPIKKAESAKKERAKPVDTRVFKMNTAIEGLRDYFELDSEGQRLLFSLQHRLATIDAVRGDGQTRARKLDWLKRWRQLIEQSLRKDGADGIVEDRELLLRGLRETVACGVHPTKRHVIGLEALLFRPYFGLVEGENPDDSLKYDDKLTGPEWTELASAFHLSTSTLNAATESVQKAMEEIKGTNWTMIWSAIIGVLLLALTGGLAAPAVGAFFGGLMGLSGAAAVSAGLAFLGGGAIAAGGLGMAGGVAVIIGGGAILGAGAGAGIGALLSSNRGLMLRELAKLEGIALSILPETLSQEESRKAVVEIIKQENELRQEIAWQRRTLKKRDDKESAAKLKEAEESLEYLRRSIERLREQCDLSAC